MTPPGNAQSVALDASLWDEPTTGIGLYARCLAGALEVEGWRVLKVGARRSGERPRGQGSRTAYFLGTLPETLATLEAPVFHAVCNFNLPLTRVPGKRFVLTVHDLIPELFPDTVSRAFRWQFRLWLGRSVKVADQILCVSQRTREDLLARHDVDPARVHVVHSGVDHVDQVPPPDATGLEYLRALGLPPQFVLYAGALEARKNVELVLDACERLDARGQPVTLVLAGQRWFGSGKIEARVAGLRSNGHDVRPLGYLADSLYYELMRRAAAVVFPSRYEGFGLPPLEAMRLGTPTVVSTAGAFPEICADGALAVAPDDAEALAEQISRLVSSPQERELWRGKGRKRAELFTWQAAARQTIDVYRAALEG
jgi:glycosyltransferase involved in cell wall biosynthesis